MEEKYDAFLPFCGGRIMMFGRRRSGGGHRRSRPNGSNVVHGQGVTLVLILVRVVQSYGTLRT